MWRKLTTKDVDKNFKSYTCIIIPNENDKSIKHTFYLSQKRTKGKNKNPPNSTSKFVKDFSTLSNVLVTQKSKLSKLNFSKFWF